MRIGAHVDQTNPLDNARAIGADVVQFFLGDPQGWKKPVLPEGVEALAGSGVDVFVHARTRSTWRRPTTGSGSRAARTSRSSWRRRRPSARRR
ncbi:hypothetical protein [Actinomadura sp. CNU-125]|uniref:hypothetical protein n=1 Tax=Actinomadura sp. CNU-125 TaxID=1904961 RepID=UPI0021CC9A4E|nr:hypothetical protein [Actinomadura sp. CNU-125]